MKKYVIKGGCPLSGEIAVGGSKNAALPILAACCLAEGPCVIGNIPKISDVTIQLEILKYLGAKVTMLDEHRFSIDCTKLRTSKAVQYDLMCGTRASYYFLGSLLGRYGNGAICMPGGCAIGVRPIDQHVKGFEALGAKVEIAKEGGLVVARAENGLKGANVYFDIGTVGGTINVMLAACRAEGMSVLENANKEPHIVDVANFLNSMGAKIRGAGTDTIKIEGVKRLHGCEYNVIPDQIEAGTFVAAAAATGCELKITNVIPKHLECFGIKFREMGVEMEDLGDAVIVRRNGSLKNTNIKTMVYPGFPTDMQPQAVVLASLAKGTSIVNEGIFENRFGYVGELVRMGAKISPNRSVAVIEGVEGLNGTSVMACDLRAGAALVVAGLAAKGVTEVRNIHFIERGYEDLAEKLRGIGADIVCVEDDSPNALEANG